MVPAHSAEQLVTLLLAGENVHIIEIVAIFFNVATEENINTGNSSQISTLIKGQKRNNLLQWYSGGLSLCRMGLCFLLEQYNILKQEMSIYQRAGMVLLFMLVNQNIQFIGGSV